MKDYEYDEGGFEMFDNPSEGAPTRGKKKGKKKGAKKAKDKSVAQRLRTVEGGLASVKKHVQAQQVFNSIAKPVIEAGYAAFNLPMPSRGVMRGVLGAGRKAGAR